MKNTSNCCVSIFLKYTFPLIGGLCNLHALVILDVDMFSLSHNCNNTAFSTLVRACLLVCVQTYGCPCPVLVCGLLWCIRVHVHLGLIGGFMPRSPSRCLACSLVSVELGIRTLRMSL